MRNTLLALSLMLLTAASASAQTLTFYRGDYMQEFNTADIDSVVFVPAGIPAGFELVDLGLPSGLKWANMNVGATTPEGYGKLFAWGETSTKSYYGWSNMRYSGGDIPHVTKYCNYDGCGTVDGRLVLEPMDDAATVHLGAPYRTPTKEEWEELNDKCTVTFTTQNGVAGALVASKTNSNSIFLPFAGSCDKGEIGRNAGTKGYYMSSTLSSYYTESYWNSYTGTYVQGTDSRATSCVLFSIDLDRDYIGIGYLFRMFGFSVRAVGK